MEQTLLNVEQTLLNDASIYVYLHLCAVTLSNQSQLETKLLEDSMEVYNFERLGLYFFTNRWRFFCILCEKVLHYVFAVWVILAQLIVAKITHKD